MSERYQGPCKSCVMYEWSLHTDSGMWCYHFRDEEHLDCPTRMALEKVESLESRCEHLETVFSELGIAFDDLRREKEAEVATLKEQLEITARLGGEQARDAIYLNQELIRAKSQLVKVWDLLMNPMSLCKGCKHGEFLQCQHPPICGELNSRLKVALGVSGEAEG